MPTSPSLQILLDSLVHGWGEKYGPILHELGLVDPDELFDLTDGEVKEVLVEPLKLAGVPPLHIARILKALKHHRSSTLTDHVDDEPVPSSTNPLLNKPGNGTNTGDDVSRTITDVDLDTDYDLDLVQAVATPLSLNEQELGIKCGSIFDSVALLGDEISLYAQEHNFHVRREKHAIVCSNAGHTTWTAVNDFEARAGKKLRQLKKANNTHGSLDSEDQDEDWRNILQSEEDQVRLFYIFR
jgi:hypothetical protein